MEGARPKLKIPLRPSDKVLEVLCGGGLAAIWAIALRMYAQLPAIIPTHFNGAGEIDGMGPKNMLWLLPAIPTVLYVGLTLLNRYPHTFNYLEEITPANAARNYRTGTRVIRYTKLFVVLIFGAILLQVTHAATQNLGIEDKGWMVKGIIAFALLFPVVIMLVSILQYRKNKNQNA